MTKEADAEFLIVASVVALREQLGGVATARLITSLRVIVGDPTGDAEAAETCSAIQRIAFRLADERDAELAKTRVVH